MKAQVKADTRSNLLNAAQLLFMKYGIRKVRIEEICKEASLSKMTFYRSFKNKMDIAEQLLVQITEEGFVAYDEIMRSSLPFQQRIQQIILMKHERSKEVSKEFINDLYQHQPELMAKLQHYRTRMILRLKEDLNTAAERGDIRINVKPDFVVFMLGAIQQKLMNEEFLAIYEDVQEAVVELTNFFFYGVMGEHNE